MSKRTLSALISATILIGIATIWALSGKPRAQTPEQPGLPVCILAGDMKSPHRAHDGFANLGNYIRLHFDANSLDDCKAMASSYCRDKMNQGFNPGNLAMTYRANPRSSNSEKLRITAHCIFENFEGEP